MQTINDLNVPGFSEDKCVVSTEDRIKAKPFDIHSVRLLDGPFRRAMGKNGEYLLSLDAGRLLCRFYESAGLEPRGPAYGGWEQATIAGHTLGHYLSACAFHYGSTGEQRFLDRVNEIVGELSRCQLARNDGYVGGVPEGDRVFAEIARGEIRSQGFDLNGIWVPWYNLHKLFAGLTDAYELCDSRVALEIACRLGDWACRITKNLTHAQWQTMLACEFGGMNEAMAQLHALTGEPGFLELADKFHHDAVLEPLREGRDSLPGLHGNTQIPKIIGAARIYELTGRDDLRRISEHFWRSVVGGHTYAIGGNTSSEYFGPSGQLAQRLTMSTAETCNTYNMLKLTKHLFAWSPSTICGDYYESAMLNHILASQDPETGMVCYFVSLHPGHFKTYGTPFYSFWCCTGTGMENHARYGEAIYFHGRNTLYVNLFVPSEVCWTEKGVTVVQQTAYPEANTSRLVVRCEPATAFNLSIRCPQWAAGPVSATVCGRTYYGEQGTFLEIERVWADGDVVEVTIPMELRLIPTPDDPNRAAIAYGPVVLAGNLGTDGIEPPAPISSEQGAYFGVPAPPVPVLVTNHYPVEDWVERAPVEGLVFQTKGVGRPADVTLVPFHEAHRLRYSVYWDLFDETSWREREASYRAAETEQVRLQAASVDYLAFGEMQPEREHDVEGEHSYPEAHAGHKMRAAWKGGWISCRMQTLAVEPVSLVVSYWGDDGRNREFEVVVDGEVIAHQVFEVSDHNRFFEATYPIPEAVSHGKSNLKVEFRARDRKIVGPICGCRVVRRTE